MAFLLESILGCSGREVGLIGTVMYRWKGYEETAIHTTPDSIHIHRLLRKMRDDGVEDVVMEVSSHALALDRVLGMTFQCAVFTNLSRDHLDFHPSYEDYLEAKVTNVAKDALSLSYKGADLKINFNIIKVGKERVKP